MVHYVRFVLRFAYYYSIVVGALNQEMDFKTFRLRLTRRVTIYSAIVNALMFAVLPIMYLTNVFEEAQRRIKYLHEYIFIMMITIRVCCVLLSLLSRWGSRQEIIGFVDEFRRVHRRFFKRAVIRRNPQVMRFWKRSILFKFCFAVITELLHLCISLQAMRMVLNWRLAISLLLLFFLTGVLNVMLGQYFFIMMNIYARYLVVNSELTALIGQARAALLQRRSAARVGGVFMTQCCALADRLEVLAAAQSSLMFLCDWLARMFGLQCVCILLIYYLTNVGFIYFGFCLYKYDAIMLDFNWWGVLLIVLATAFYYADMWVSSNVVFLMLDAHAETSWILQQHSELAALDVRLEAAFESFHLQMARNPVQRSFYGLFNMDRQLIFSVAGSLLVHSLVLIQYDIKNY